jgi:hypothetical protein
MTGAWWIGIVCVVFVFVSAQSKLGVVEHAALIAVLDGLSKNFCFFFSLDKSCTLQNALRTFVRDFELMSNVQPGQVCHSRA